MSYIVIEGIDGSGKSTQAKRLAKALDAVFVVEPTSGPIGKLIRARINAGEVDAAVMARLFAADRHALAAGVIRPALAEGKTVVSDRNVISSLVYQSEGDLTVDAVWDLNMKGAPLPTPDLVVVVRVSIEVATERLRANREFIDAFETQERLARHLERYEKLGEFVRWPVVYVDGESDVETVANAVLGAVESVSNR